jgi:hypothetical protein
MLCTLAVAAAAELAKPVLMVQAVLAAEVMVELAHPVHLQPQEL